MKQHITTKQLKELSPEHMKGLTDWWWSKIDEMDRFVEVDANKTIGSTIAPDSNWMTIGRMIEFLLEKDKLSYDEDGRPALPVYTYPISSEAICDALWEAVKNTIQI